MLPPIAALESFALAAASESFSNAGATLGLTQSAVSRQIAMLEDWLQARLFDRHGRRVRLTAAGRAYADAVRPALAEIHRATARAIGDGDARPLGIATLPSFGMRWLAPRLPSLTARHADIVISFTARSDMFDIAAEGLDAAIHYGRDDWPDAACDRLFDEQNVAVVAPSLLDTDSIARGPDFAHLPLLSQTARRGAWLRWFTDHASPVPPDPVGLVFDHFLMVAQAAVAGSGAALLPRFLIEPELAAGTLVAPLPEMMAGEGAYWLVYPPARLQSVRFRRFREWLLDEAKAMPDAAGS